MFYLLEKESGGFKLSQSFTTALSLSRRDLRSVKGRRCMGGRSPVQYFLLPPTLDAIVFDLSYSTGSEVDFIWKESEIIRDLQL